MKDRLRHDIAEFAQLIVETDAQCGMTPSFLFLFINRCDTYDLLVSNTNDAKRLKMLDEFVLTDAAALRELLLVKKIEKL